MQATHTDLSQPQGQPQGQPQPQGPEKLPGIRHIIAVGSGKGGVGKSTVSTNLALALQQTGASVGLVDADILGPSICGMLGINTSGQPAMTAEGKMIPAQRFGLKVVSMAMFTGDDTPAVLRGPMVTKYLRLFTAGVEWGNLDYLILDLPPGTGDTQLTIAQSTPLSGVVIVTTPQAVSLKIARRGLRMFQKVHVPILGIVENMRTFTCPHCGETTDIFRHGGGEKMSQELEVPFLGALPLASEVVTCGDEGRPIVAGLPQSASAQVYTSIAAQLVQAMRNTATVLKPFMWDFEANTGAPQWLANDVHKNGAIDTPIGMRKRDARTLTVLWEDGVQSDFDVRDLRLACQCALCVEEMSGRPLLDPKTVRADVAPKKIMSVGNYAIGFDWNDGHNSGIHAFTRLRKFADEAAANRSEDV
jgi:ATP-binding protein involved in chromosome partitioning